MKLSKVYKNTIFPLILFQICFNFCCNKTPSALTDKSITNQNKLKNFNNIKNKNFENKDSQSIDEYIDEILKSKSNDINENNLFLIEKTSNLNLNYNNNSTAKNKTNNNNKTKADKKPFFNYKKNKTSADADQGIFRDLNGKWDVIALIKAADLMLEAFININPRLKIKNGKLWLTKILIKQYEECDSNSDSKLDLKEFKDCVGKQKYFAVLYNVPGKHAEKVFTRQRKLQIIYGVSSIDQFVNENKNSSADSNSSSSGNKTKNDKNKNNTKRDKDKDKNTNYLELLFNTLNDSKNKYFSIHEYIKLRFLMLIYKKCSSNSFFISKSDFECIANEFNPEGYTKKQNTLSRIFNQIQSFSRFESLNELDTINALSTLQSIDLFGKINKKHVDLTVSKAVFLEALGANELPARFNAKNIELLFSQLANEGGKLMDKIDLHSFVFVDRFLRIFHDNSSKFKLVNVNENYVDVNGFLNCFRSFFFPDKYLRLLMVHLREYDVRNITKFEINKELNFIPLNLKANVEADRLTLLQKNDENINENNNNKSYGKKLLRNKYFWNSNSNFKNINFNFKEKAVAENNGANASASRLASTQSTTTTTTTTKKITKKSSSNSSSTSNSSSSSSGGSANSKKIIKKNVNIINNSNRVGLPAGENTSLSRNQQKSETSGLFFNNKIDILLPKNFNIYLEKFFDIIYRRMYDRDFVRFDDFLYLIQFMYLYPKTELKYNLFTEKGKLYDFFSLYSDFPLISPRFYNRYPSFRKIKDNTVMDFYIAFLFFGYEDLISKVKSDEGLSVNKLSMAEIKMIFDRVHILNVPEFLYQRCYTNKEDRISKLEGQFDVNCMFNICFEYIGQNINNNLLSHYFDYNMIAAK